MTVHYLVTAYGNQQHLRRLVQRLCEAHPAGISVQWDGSKGHLDRQFGAIGVDVLIPDHPIEWGDASYLDALLASLRKVPAADWVVLLSGQDYPIRAVYDFHRWLEAATFAGILHSRPVDRPGRPPWSEEQRRYFFRHRWVPPIVWQKAGGSRGIGRVLHGMAALPAVRRHVYYRSRSRGLPGALALRVRRDPFSVARPCRKGADYFALRWDLVEELLDSASREPELLQYFRQSAIPTEGWFCTVLGHHGEALVDEVLHFTRFERQSSPRILQIADVADAGRSGKYFARKFDDGSASVLDAIDERLLGRAV